MQGHSDTISTCDFNPDASLVVTGSWDRKIKVIITVFIIYFLSLFYFSFHLSFSLHSFACLLASFASSSIVLLFSSFLLLSFPLFLPSLSRSSFIIFNEIKRCGTWYNKRASEPLKDMVTWSILFYSLLMAITFYLLLLI